MAPTRVPGDRVTQEHRWERNGHRGCVVWLTGLSGSGKSTLSLALEAALFDGNLHPFVLDGDILRQGLNSNLGFSQADRSENVRRAAAVGVLMASAGQVAIIGLIAPYRSDRLAARSSAEAVGCAFVEVFVDAPLEVCEQRDPKKLYKRARAGEIRDFTGIDAPYEAPLSPEVRVRTASMSIADCIAAILAVVLPRLSLNE